MRVSKSKNKLFQSPDLANKPMNSYVYALRREVIKLIREAKKLVPSLPRIEVRVTQHHERILGQARRGKCVIWMTENFVASRSVVFHELLHAAYGVLHDESCPLMRAGYSGELTKKQCNELFKKHALKARKASVS